MTENKSTTEQKTRTIPADAATPFYTFSNLWKGEMQRVLDETTSAMEKGFAEYERAVTETSRFSAAQARAMHEAGRALLNGARVMMG
jgi:hypothetical protein